MGERHACTTRRQLNSWNKRSLDCCVVLEPPCASSPAALLDRTCFFKEYFFVLLGMMVLSVSVRQGDEKGENMLSAKAAAAE